MIVHELVVNCFKHAVPGDRKGTVRVSCGREAHSRVRVSVADDGVGMSELNSAGQGAGGQAAAGQATPARGVAGSSARAQRGLGWALIDALAKQLGTTPEITRQGGTHVALCFDDRIDGTES